MAMPILYYRVGSQGWPIGAVLIPPGTLVDTGSVQGAALRDLVPPYDVQCLDMTTYNFLQAAFPFHHHLMGPPPTGSG